MGISGAGVTERQAGVDGVGPGLFVVLVEELLDGVIESHVWTAADPNAPSMGSIFFSFRIFPISTRSPLYVRILLLASSSRDALLLARSASVYLSL